MDNDKKTPIWIDDPKILYIDKNYLKFFPSKNMSMNEIINALTLFSIYLFILFYLFASNKNTLIIPFVMVIVIILFYKLDYFDENKVIEKFNQEKQPKCVKPTEDNPFMNVMFNDYLNNQHRPYACDITDPKIEKEVDHLFDKNTFRNVDDIYDRNVTQRQYYTMPISRTYNDQIEFGKWLFNTPKSCKEDTNNCLRYEDLRYKKFNQYTDNYNSMIDEFKMA